MSTLTSTRPTASRRRAPAPPTRRRRPRLSAPGAGRIALLLLAAALTLGPVIWTLSTSFRTPAESFTLPPQLIPTDPQLTSYRSVFDTVDIVRLTLNSVLVTAFIAVGQMVTAAMAGYAFAMIDFKGKGVMFGTILATMMVPVQVTIVPVFILIRGMHLSDTLLALILPAIPTAFGTFLMRQYFLGMPRELGEAALVDGASPWRVFASIYAPMATPGLAIVGILAFNYHWNEFFRPLVLETSEENFTLPLGLVSLQGNLGTGSISVVLAGVILSMLPAVAVFLFGQRQLREGITSAGVNR